MRKREELFTTIEHIERKELGFIMHDRCFSYVFPAFYCGNNLHAQESVVRAEVFEKCNVDILVCA